MDLLLAIVFAPMLGIATGGALAAALEPRPVAKLRYTGVAAVSGAILLVGLASEALL